MRSYRQNNTCVYLVCVFFPIRTYLSGFSLPANTRHTPTPLYTQRLVETPLESPYWQAE